MDVELQDRHPVDGRERVRNHEDLPDSSPSYKLMEGEGDLDYTLNGDEDEDSDSDDKPLQTTDTKRAKHATERRMCIVRW